MVWESYSKVSIVEIGSSWARWQELVVFQQRGGATIRERVPIQHAIARDQPGVLKYNSIQHATTREQPGVLKYKSIQRATTREQLGVLKYE